MYRLQASYSEEYADDARCLSCGAPLGEADRVVWKLGNDGRVLLQENAVVVEFEGGCGLTCYPTYDRGLCRKCRRIRIKVGKIEGLGVNTIQKANCHCDSSSPVGGCCGHCPPFGEGLTREERCQLVGACFCLSSALQGQGSVSGSGGVRDGFDRYAQHRDLIGKVGEHLILGGQLSPVARKFLKRDLAYLIGEISLQSFDAFQRIFDGIKFIHNSSSPVGDETLSFPSDPTGEGSTSSVSGEGVE